MKTGPDCPYPPHSPVSSKYGFTACGRLKKYCQERALHSPRSDPATSASGGRTRFLAMGVASAPGVCARASTVTNAVSANSMIKADMKVRRDMASPHFIRFTCSMSLYSDILSYTTVQGIQAAYRCMAAVSRPARLAMCPHPESRTSNPSNRVTGDQGYWADGGAGTSLDFEGESDEVAVGWEALEVGEAFDQGDAVGQEILRVRVAGGEGDAVADGGLGVGVVGAEGFGAAFIDELEGGFVEARLVGDVVTGLLVGAPVPFVPAEVDQDDVGRANLTVLGFPGSDVGGGQHFAGVEVAGADVDHAGRTNHLVDREAIDRLVHQFGHGMSRGIAMGADVLWHEDRIGEVAVAFMGDRAMDYQWRMGWPDRCALFEDGRQINHFGPREQRLEIAQQVGSGSAHLGCTSSCIVHECASLSTGGGDPSIAVMNARIQLFTAKAQKGNAI